MWSSVAGWDIRWIIISRAGFRLMLGVVRKLAVGVVLYI
jgi:hypothetical protein